MKIKVIITCFLLTYSFQLFAQNEIWEKLPNNAQNELKAKIQSEKVYPTKSSLFSIDDSEMKSILNTAPKRSDNIDTDRLPIISIPTPDGEFLRFYIEEASIMHPDLQSKFPNIKSFAGSGVEEKDCYLRFDYSHKGYHFQILSAKYGTIKIDPVKSEPEVYQCFYKRDVFVSDDQDKFVCEFDGEVHDTEDYVPNSNSSYRQGDNDLRDYRCAVACTGEYAAYHGGTVADAMAAINTTMTRVNGIFETDFSITMTLIANNEDVVYTNASTDPFSNGSAGAMINQNRDNMNAVIGSANFDVGHVFGTAGSGLAALNAVCGNSKARGVTAIGNPVGDFFDVDYVAHEFGHQFGGNHTQYNSCNRNNSTAMEPGSASTIMGYAGICNPNVQSNSDAYFHAISIQEIENYTTNGNGDSCPTTTDLGNTIPTVSSGGDYTIPRSTPYILTATASDADGDILTYTWEQMDNFGSQTQPPSPTNTNGPMYRSLEPSLDNQRYMPSLPDVIAGNTPTWEVLSSVSRNLNFRVTVRDNRPGNGLTEEDDALITVDGSSGPFVVTAPNTAVTWNTGGTQTITWDVANTNNAPVSCANVDIMLSTDGGFTYTVNLASNVSNDGSHDIVVPDIETTTARVRVMCSDNIFYDISDQNFTIDDSCVIDNITINQNYNSGDTEIISVGNNITATNIIRAGANIEYSAEVDIDLNIGFEVEIKGEFHAYIGPCQ